MTPHQLRIALSTFAGVSGTSGNFFEGAGQSLFVTAPAPRSLTRLSAYRVPAPATPGGKSENFFWGPLSMAGPQVLPAATCAPVSTAVPGSPEF